MKSYLRLGAVLGAALLLFATTGGALAASVTPTLMPGWINDAEISCDDGVEFELPGAAYDTPASVAFTDSDTSSDGVTVDISWDAETRTLDFEAEGGVVVEAHLGALQPETRPVGAGVPAGPSYNFYDYTPDGVAADTDLVAPTWDPTLPQGGIGPFMFGAILCTQLVAPSFVASQEGETQCDCDADLIGTTNSSSPSDASWLLVVAMGVLLASAVVLTPARIRNRK